MRNEFQKVIQKLYRENDKLVTVVADSGTEELDQVRQNYPDRVVDAGISECSAVGIAAGIAASGGLPILYGMASFLVYRAFEFIRDDICLQKLKVMIVGSGAGVIYNNLGPTHHATEDIAVMNVLPYIKILSIASPKEVEPIMRCALEIDGPVYIRFGKAWEEEIYENAPVFRFGIGTELMQGDDVTIISTGSIVSSVLKAGKMLKEKGYSVRVLNMSTIKPMDEESILCAAQKTHRILVVEEHSTTGGLAGIVAMILLKAQIPVKFEQMGFDRTFCEEYGWYQDIKKICGLGERDIYKKALKLLSDGS